MAWKDMGEDIGYREERHQAARRVLDRRLRKGTPLVLYLRLFGGVEVLQDTDAGAYLTENYLLDHLDYLDRGIDLITVQQPGWAVSYDSMRTSGDLRRRAPALLIDDSQWFSVVQELIALADLIVSECSAATSSMAPLRDGVRAELKSCLEVKAQERTVLILPSRAASSAMTLAYVDNDELVQKFSRCFYSTQFPTQPLLWSFVVRDLLDRARRIARLSGREKKALIDPRKRLQRFPITFNGVALGFMQQADDAELVAQSETDDDAWHYRLGSYFRAAAVNLRLLLTHRAEPHVVAQSLIHCYLQMGFLMLRTKKRGNSVVILGDLMFARRCADSVVAFIRDSGSLEHIPLAERLYTGIEALDNAARVHPGQYLPEPLVGPIAGTNVSLSKDLRR